MRRITQQQSNFGGNGAVLLVSRLDRPRKGLAGRYLLDGTDILEVLFETEHVLDSDTSIEPCLVQIVFREK